MKKVYFIVLIAIATISCRNQQKTDDTMIPVEADDGIGDGAPSLDSILKAQNDTLQKPKK
ncbi:MAG: hypothetical protein CMC70_07450 [Flavobacteriaceae bacterium]|nr:hypothetical protein [Flavobacteriaceae bacterium]